MAKAYDIDAGTIRRVDWLELVPLTLFFRAFAVTFKPSFLFLGAFLVILSSYVGVDNAKPKFNSSWTDARVAAGARSQNADNVRFRVGDSFGYATAPACRLFNVVSSNTPGSETSLGAGVKDPAQFAGRFVAFLIAVWLALAISRTAVVRLTSTTQSSTAASLKYAAKRLLSALLVVALFIMFEAIFFILVLAAPLGLAAIGAENCDGFDAISRSVSYIVQRALIWAVYAFVAQILILVGCYATSFVCLHAYLFYANSLDMTSSGWVYFWGLTLANIPVAYAYVAAIVYCCAIYVQLRRSVDGTPFDTCALNLNGTAPRKLRKILKDGKGAPTFDAQHAELTEKNTDVPEEKSPGQEE